MKSDPSAKVKIGEAAKILGISTKTLRRWEAAGKITSERTPGGTRLYSEKSLALQNNIPLKDLAKEAGVSERTIRRWEEKGKIQSFKTQEGSRVYNPADLKNQTISTTPKLKVESNPFSKVDWHHYLNSQNNNPQIVLINNQDQEDQAALEPIEAPASKQIQTGGLFVVLIIAILATSGYMINQINRVSNTQYQASNSLIGNAAEVLAEQAVRGFLEVNGDVEIKGATTAESYNDLIITATNNPTLTVTDDITLDQSISSTSSPSFVGVSLSDLLSLGSLTSDPATATNGDSYYNTSTNKFRCYQNGSWKDCDTDTDTTNSGDITAVNVGNGLSGGGSDGDVTVSLDVTTTSTTTTTSANSGLETTSAGLSLLRGCSSNNVLVWDSTDVLWECAAIGADSITADSLDFTQFKDSLTLDATTNIATAGFNLTTSGTGAVSLNNTGGFTVASTSTFSNDVSIASGKSILPTVTGGSDLGSSSLKFNNLWVNNINSSSSSSFSGQTIFTYEPTSTAISQSSVWINPTTPLANSSLLGISVAGVEKARINSNGYLGLGGANDPGSSYIINAGSIFNVGTGGSVGIGTSSPGALLDTEFRTTTGTISKIGVGTSQTLTGTLTGLSMDLSTNVTATGQNIVGQSIITNPAVSNSANGDFQYKGLVITGGTITNTRTGEGGLNTFTGADITIPTLVSSGSGGSAITGNGIKITTGNLTHTDGAAITQNAIYIDLEASTLTGSSTTLNGINITGDVNSGTGNENGIKITNIDAQTNNYAIYSSAAAQSYFAGNVGVGDSSPTALFTVGTNDMFQITSTGLISNSPTTTGTLIDYNLEAEWTGGTVFNANFSSTTTQASAIVGTNYDFSTNVTVPNSSSGNQTGIALTLLDGGGSAISTAISTAGTYDTGISIGGTPTTGINVASNLAANTGLIIRGGTITTGKAIEIAWNNTGGLSDFSGDYIVVNPVRTVNSATTTTDSGNFLDLDRQFVVSDGSSTFNLIGQILKITDSNTASAGTLANSSDTASITRSCSGAGTCTDSGDVLSLTQSYTSATGATLMVTNLGGSSSTSFRVNDETGDTDTTPFIIDAAGNVGIGDTSPDAKLELLSTTEQLRLTHTDGSVDVRMTMDSSGNLTFDASADGTGSETFTLTGFTTLTTTDITAFNCTDCIDFDDLEDTLDIDATTTINTTATTTNPLSYLADQISSGTALAISADALTTGTALDITSASAAGTAGTSDTLVSFTRSGTHAGDAHTSYGIKSSVTTAGTNSINVAGYFNATTAGTNIGVQIPTMSGDANTGFKVDALSGNTTNIGLNIGAIDDTGTGWGVLIGDFTNTGATQYGIQIGNFSGTHNGGTTAGIKIGNISSAGTTTTNYGLQLGTMTGGTTSNYQIQTGNITAVASATNAALVLGTTKAVTGTAASSTNYGINILPIDSTGTVNYGLYVGAVSGATSNYAAIFAGGNVGIGTASPGVNLDVVTGTAGSDTIIRSYNTDNTNGASDAILYTRVGGSSGGDPLLTFEITDVVAWNIGVDNSDSDKFQIGTGISGVGSGELLTIQTDGFVGIGDTSPDARLDVEGDSTVEMRITSTTGNTAGQLAFYENTAMAWTLDAALAGGVLDFKSYNGGSAATRISLADSTANTLDVSGTVQMTIEANDAGVDALCGSTALEGDASADVANETIRDCSGAPTADYMEMYPMNSDIEIGDIVAPNGEYIIDKVGKRVPVLSKSTAAYQKSVIGIASDPEGAGDFNSIGYTLEDSDNPWPLALSGRVPVKIAPDSQAISRGDSITASDTAGRGMKAIQPGYVVGKALEDWTPGSGQDTVLVLVTVSYADPGNFFASLSLDAEGNLIVPKIKTGQLTLAPNLLTDANSPSALNPSPTTPTTELGQKLAELEERLANIESEIAGEATSSAQITEEEEPEATSSGDLALEPVDSLLATESASLTPQGWRVANLNVTETISSEKLLTALDATISGVFKALGEVVLGTTTIAGDLTVDGTFSISENTINALPTLYIQNSALATNVDFFNGLVTIDHTGNLIAQTITADEYKGTTGKSVGTSAISAGSKSVEISSTLVKETSKILVTPRVETTQILSVSLRVEGEKFTVSVPTISASEITFDWFIINEAN